ncbi:MAG: glutathione S-transferase family protein [Woeseiaceae bacterium]|nr:glutathione S-transferase family protein [Woeseiaceae bacterium]
MKFYYAPKTRSVRIAWLLEEAGIDYEIVPITLGNPDHPADFLAASPMGKVPAIRDDSTAMAESAAICVYVCDRYPEAGLAPPLDHEDRGPYLYWTMYTPAVIEPAMAEKMFDLEPNPRSFGWGSFELMISTLEKQLEQGPWLLGEAFSGADIITGSSVVYLQMFGILPESEILSAYAKRCLDRPAYQRAMSLDAN